MNNQWSTSDKTQFVSGGWNTGLPKYVYSMSFVSKYASHLKHLEDSFREGTFAFRSPLEPGKFEKCTVNLYIREHQPSWKTFPCDVPFSRYWICKNYAIAKNTRQQSDLPSLLCRGRSLLIDNTCFEYRLAKSLGNDSVVCGFDNAYLAYVNQNLAHHGVSILFILRCTDLKIHYKNVQGILPFHDEGYNFTLSYVKIFQLKISNTDLSLCGHTMQQCDDGSCRIQSILCMLDFECAPNVCKCMIGYQLNHNVSYCRHQCPPSICTCAPLMFQCSTGGCIPYTYVCDNEYNCADSSDEFCFTQNSRGYFSRNEHVNLRSVSTKDALRPFGSMCSTGLFIDVQLVNDLIPDCADARDELHSMAIKFKGLPYQCKDKQNIPCVPSHSKCFEINVLCVYDHDNLGNIAYCRDGSHLLNCRYINCINTFKCPRSYCIPLRKVCDGIYDCYGREDEINCNNNICPGYLKCREFEFCIHPTEICDGYSHCPHGDDEELCDSLGCPTGCTCLGRGVVCRDKRSPYMPALPFVHITYLSWGSNHTHIPSFANLSSLFRLVILDLSRSVIINICPAFRKQHTFYRTLQALYLQYNNITHISSNCFTKLLSLLVINLQGNPVFNIANDAFRDVSLNVLVLRNTDLSSLSGKWVHRFYHLKALDARGVKLLYLSQTDAKILNELEIVYTDDIKLCCILQNIHRCYGYKGNSRNCFRLLSHSLASPILLFFAITILIFILISMWFVAKLFAVSKPIQCLLHNVILTNRSLCLLYVVSIITIDGFHGKHYILWYGSLVNRFVCQGLSIILSSGLVMSNIATSLLDHIAHMAVTRMLFSEIDKKPMVILILFSLHVLMITGFSVITFWTDNKIHHEISANHICGAPLGLSLADYTWTVTGPVFLSIVISFSLIYSIYTYVAIFKSSYSSGKLVQSMASTEINIHKKRLHKLMKTLSYSMAFRFLECWPIACIVILNVYGTGISFETGLMSIITAIVFGCIGGTLPSIWFPMYKPKV